MKNKLLKSIKAKTYWTTIYFVEPVAIPFALLLSNFKGLRPNFITLSSLLLTLSSALCFSAGVLPLGCLFYYLSLVFDKADGKLARMTEQCSDFGSRLDKFIDKVNKLLPMLGLIYGYYYKNNLLLLGVILVFGLHYGIHFLYHYAFRIKLAAPDTALIEIPEANRPSLFGIRRVYNVFSPQDEAFFILIVGPLTGFVTETIIVVSLVYLVIAPVMYWKMKRIL